MSRLLRSPVFHSLRHFLLALLLLTFTGLFITSHTSGSGSVVVSNTPPPASYFDATLYTPEQLNFSTIDDGIPDVWKDYYGFSLADPELAQADYNGSGVTNLVKYHANLWPLDAAPPQSQATAKPGAVKKAVVLNSSPGVATMSSAAVPHLDPAGFFGNYEMDHTMTTRQAFGQSLQIKWGYLPKIGAWVPVVGNQVEVWQTSFRGLSYQFVELDASKGSHGIKQQVEDAAPGTFLLTWKHVARDNKSAGNNGYKVLVYTVDGSTSRVLARKDFPKDGAVNAGDWSLQGLAFAVKPEDIAPKNKPARSLWIALDSNDNNTYGTLIDDIHLTHIEIVPDKSMYGPKLTQASPLLLSSAADTTDVTFLEQGRIGDVVPSVKQGGEKHFVTPKWTQDINGDDDKDVVLKAETTLSEDEFKKVATWEVLPSGAGKVDESDARKFLVKRDTARKVEVFIKPNGSTSSISPVKMNIWIVWATPTTGYPKKLSTNSSSVKGYCVPEVSSMAFIMDIEPKEMFDGFIAGRDVPKLNGNAQSLSSTLVFTQATTIDEDSANRRWDMSRRLRVKLKDKVATPSLVSTDYNTSRGLALAITNNATKFPVSDLEVMSFPTARWQGNDDPDSTTSADNDPYSDKDSFIVKRAGESVDPKPGIGQIASYDRPGAPAIRVSAGTPASGEEVEGWLQFEEFARLELGEGNKAKWYIICDPIKWESIKRFKRKTNAFGLFEEMRENGSTTNLGHSAGY